MISDEESGHVIIGEAAVNLIFNQEEVSLEALLSQLQTMAENEPSDERLLTISAACRWLSAFRQPGSGSAIPQGGEPGHLQWRPDVRAFPDRRR